MNSQERLVQLVPPEDNAISVNENLLDEKPLYLFHEHFSCSDHDHGLNNPPEEAQQRQGFELWEADTYRYKFNLAVFIKALIISLVDISGFGILIILYRWIFRSKYVSNFYEIGFVNNYIDVFGWINMLFVIYSIYERNFIYTEASCLMYIVGLLFLSIICASLNSFINPKIPALLNTVELSEKSQQKTGLFFGDLNTKEELKRTILRLNFDASSFFMTFIENPTSEFFKRKILPEDPAEIKEEEDRLVLDRPVRKQDLIAEAVEFEDAVFNHKFLTKVCRYDENKAYGYTYVEKVLEAYKPSYRSFRFLIISALIGVVAISYMKLDDASENDNEGFVKKYIVKGGMLLLNVITSIIILDIVNGGAKILWTRLDFVKGMTELISEEKPLPGSIFRKNCSMINIFDFESLRTWASLRMVFMNLNERRLEAISLAISIIVAVQLVTISVLGFFYFTAVEPEQKDFFLQYIIFFGAPTIVYMIFVLLFIYLGAQVNNQYQEHIYLLKSLKMTIYKLFTLYPIFNGEGCIKPTTYLYARGLRYLRKLYGEATTEVLDENLGKISDAYEEVITELETEEQYYPLKILGIPMTDSFVTTVLGTIVGVVMIPVSKYLTEITGWG